MRMSEARIGTWKTVGDANANPAKLSNHSAMAHDLGVKHDVTAVRDVAAKSRSIAVNASPRIVRTAATDATREQGGDVLIAQWTVVTSWRSEDGSRAVMTSSRVIQSDAPAGEQEVQAPPAQEMHPYAAVPVRGGWLVFQL
jgi:hypothetical protein